MSERIEKLLKLACLCFGGVILFQLAGIMRAGGTAEKLVVPEIAVVEPEETEPDASPETPPDVPPGFPAGMPPGMPMTMPGGPPGMPGGRGPSLDPALQARVDVILKSEMFGPVPKPPPMALMGIAGSHAMLRTDNGQTGLIAVGETLGDTKLLRIGTNRVLVEKDGEEKELTLFSGYGSESLLKK